MGIRLLLSVLKGAQAMGGGGGGGYSSYYYVHRHLSYHTCDPPPKNGNFLSCRGILDDVGREWVNDRTLAHQQC